jgi:demethylspheroidene O-methyltransferase
VSIIIVGKYCHPDQVIDFHLIRDALLRRADIRARIGRWPIGRGIAARHTRRLFGIVGGFVETQMLLAALELGVFDALCGGPRPWAEATDLAPQAARTLRQALVAIGLVEDRRGGRTGLTIDGLVVATDVGLQAMIRHNRLLYADLSDPVALLRGEGAPRIAAFWPYAGASGDPAGYAELMAASQSFVADALLGCVDFGASRRVMDVGGGNGQFLSVLTARHPHIAATLIDLPDVVAVAQARGLAPNIEAVGVAAGDPLPREADTITLIRVLHDRDDESAAAFLAAVADALPPDGRVVVAEPMAAPGYDPQTSYFAAYCAAMQSGRLRTSGEIAALLRSAGLRASGAVKRPSPLLNVMLAQHDR